MFDIGGATAVKHHPFFEGIDWAKLIALQVEPPLKPDLGSTTDTSNFSAEFVEMALPRSLSQESLMSHGDGHGPPTGVALDIFRGFSFVADSFVDERNWQHDQERDGFSFVPEENSRPNIDAPRAGINPPKKAKGKRVRNKKGKAKEPLAGVPVKGAPFSVAGGSKHVGEDRAESVANVASENSSKGMFEREPLVQADSKPSALAVMLEEQKKKPPSTYSQFPSGSRRPNVWGARELPAPAPVPTPAGPPLAQGWHLSEGDPSLPKKKQTAKNPTSIPGRRAAGNTFVWERPI